MSNSVLRLGIDVACKAAHRASLADRSGTFIWSGRSFHTRLNELEDLWDRVMAHGDDDTTVEVVMEPTRNAWAPLASWLTARDARVVLVPPEQSADLRDYYNKHTKTDRLDSRVLARLPLLHPEGLTPVDHDGPADPLKRAVRLALQPGQAAYRLHPTHRWVVGAVRTRHDRGAGWRRRLHQDRLGVAGPRLR